MLGCGDDPADSPADAGVASSGETAPSGDAGSESDAATPEPSDATAGSADSAMGDDAVPATFATVQWIITQAPCFGAGCHNDDQNALRLPSDDQLYGTLLSHRSASCGNLPLVSPGDPAGSALVKILREPCGPTPRMPLGCVDDGDGACVPPEFIAAVEQWIANGAPSP